MTDLERIELALRKALAAPNPHAKCEVYFRNFIEELTAMNNEQHGLSSSLWRLYERDKRRQRKTDPQKCGLCSEYHWACGETLCPQPKRPKV